MIRCRFCKNWLITPRDGGDAYPVAATNRYPTTSGLAIASMILGILWIYWMGSIVALVLGYLAMREIREDPQGVEGKGMAVAGIVLGWVGMATLLLAILMGVYLWQNQRDRQTSPEPVKSALHRCEDQLIARGRRDLGENGLVGLFLGVGSFLGSGGDGPEGGVGQEAADELGVQRMARLMGFHPRQERQTHQGQIANQVQSLVSAKLVGEAQRAVHDAVLGEDDGVFERSTADQAHGPQRLDIAVEAEGARAGKQVAESVSAHDHLYFLLADQRMWEIHIAADAKLICGVDADAAITFADFQRLHYLQITALAAQLPHAGLFQHLHERLGGAVQDRHFDGIDVDVDVVDAAGIDRGKEMLGGGQQHALLHQAGGIAYAGNVVPLGFDGEVIQIDSTENNAGLRWCGDQAHGPLHARVQAHTHRAGFSG